MFVAQNKVRMDDTDMANVIFFAKQFHFAHEAFEDFLEHLGLRFHEVFNENEFIFVIVHADADYIAPLSVGDIIEIHLKVAKIGTSSFTIAYEIYKMDKTLVGKATTVHVTLDAKTRKKIPIPDWWRKKLEKYHAE